MYVKLSCAKQSPDYPHIYLVETNIISCAIFHLNLVRLDGRNVGDQGIEHGLQLNAAFASSHYLCHPATEMLYQERKQQEYVCAPTCVCCLVLHYVLSSICSPMCNCSGFFFNFRRYFQSYYLLLLSQLWEQFVNILCATREPPTICFVLSLNLCIFWGNVH